MEAKDRCRVEPIISSVSGSSLSAPVSLPDRSAPDGSIVVSSEDGGYL